MYKLVGDRTAREDRPPPTMAFVKDVIAEVVFSTMLGGVELTVTYGLAGGRGQAFENTLPSGATVR